MKVKRGRLKGTSQTVPLRSARIGEVSLVVKTIERVAPLGLLLKRIGSFPQAFVLGDFGAAGVGRYSYLGLEPREVLVFKADNQGNPFGKLNEAWEKYQLKVQLQAPAPFVGGWVGYLSYDLGRYIEQLPDGVEHDIKAPLAQFGFYDAVLAWDHQEQKGYLLALEYEGQQTKPAQRLEKLRHISASGEDVRKEITPRKDNTASTQEIIERMEGNITKPDYLEKVAQAVEYIKAGDIFEVNLSQRFACAYDSSGEVLYEHLARHNPAGYAALLKAADHTIVSASPELFLSQRDKRIVTRPIKGTTPRGPNAQEDQKNRQRLEQSEKDIAELNMIIDLERNDLGRVCRYGTVKVIAQRQIEVHPTVFHAVATVTGELRKEVSRAEIMRATFPGGSITGAPKIRAMEIIDELEPTARSVYTGSIGWVGVNGDMDLNIAIRTVILSSGRAYVQAGGAVVADSKPEAEYEETIDKAAALVKAVWATKEV